MNQLSITKNQEKGFTLIELLVVIGILAVLLSIVLVAINPGRQFAQANNTQRRSDVGAILNAIHQYSADNRGALPTGVPVAGSPAVNIDSTGDGVTLCNALVPTYIAALPRDPLTGSYTDCSTFDTQYEITTATVSAGGTPRIMISAPDTELDIADISVTR